MILSNEDFLNRLNTYIGEDNSDDAISLLEDMTDTYNDLSSRINKSGEDWEQKYNANNTEWENKYNNLDKSWRTKYQERFFNNPTAPEPFEDKKEPEVKPLNFNDLFSRKEK